DSPGFLGVVCATDAQLHRRAIGDWIARSSSTCLRRLGAPPFYSLCSTNTIRGNIWAGALVEVAVGNVQSTGGREFMDMALGTWRVSIQRIPPTSAELTALYNAAAHYWPNALQRLGFLRAYARSAEHTS